MDDDCDTVSDDGVEPPDWYFDGDADGYGDPARPLGEVSCAPPEGYVDNSSDCNDADSSLSPDTPWFPDADGDGYGDTAEPTRSCVQPPGLIRDGTGCDDTRQDVSPAGEEVCDEAEADEDCDGLKDDADTSAKGQSLWYADADADGLGTVFSTTWACDAPSGYTDDHRDCDDGDRAVTRDCRWAQLSAGQRHTCGLLGDGTVRCWGDDSMGALDAPDEGFVEVAARALFTCGVLATGELSCWGDDTDGQTEAPTGRYAHVDADTAYACATSGDGAITCWGTQPWGDPPPSGTGYMGVSVGYSGGCALDAAGDVTGWYGASSFAGPYIQTEVLALDCMLLDPAGNVSDLPEGWEALVPVSGVAAMSARYFSGGHSCVLGVDGTVACTGVTGDPPPPDHFVSIATGDLHACGITTDGQAECWGEDGSGQCDVPPM